MASFEKIVNTICKKINWIAGIAISAMVLLICADIILRLLPKVKPIMGAFEVENWLAALAAAFAVAYIQTQKGHVPVDILVARVSKRTAAIISSITSPFLVGLSGMISWQCAAYGLYMLKSNEVSQILKFPYHFLLYGVAFCFAMLTLVFLVEFLNSLIQAVKR